jgi:hypothetical protein
MLPSYVTGLKTRVNDEIGWLKTFVSDPARQSVMCGVFGAQMGGCVAFTAKMQQAKVQALQASLDVLVQLEVQLDTDLAQKIAAFNIVSLTDSR